ncbi:hypothetical protein GUY60_29125 [Streptomyces sp. YC537]|uniref:Integral membrane protein n=1 Tax=Streptomyces boluensis TaxID=1775135 RepID=A0A964XQA3_9ACTN|nr:hypothetical protein [Streptomyces boluensis]
MFYAGSAMPNHATAMGATAAVGCFVRYGGGERRPALLCGLALGLAVATSMRPNDAVWIAAPLLLAPLVHRPWRAFAPAAAVLAGVLAGVLPWAMEAVLRYGGIPERLALASGQQGDMRPRFALPYLVTALDGPLLCRPCARDGLQLPVALWWFALPVLVGAGLWLVRREPPQLRAALRLATVVAVSSALTYAFLVDYTAPRFLFTAYALLMLPASVALLALVRAVRARGRAAVAVLVLVLCAHLAVQWVTLAVHVRVQTEARRDWVRIAGALRSAGVGPGCVLGGNSSVVPVAYTARCHPAVQHPGRIPDALALRRAGPPPELRHWRVLPVPGSYNGWRIALPPASVPSRPAAAR